MELEEGMDILESIMADGPSVTITITTPRRNFRSPSEMRESHGHVEGVINLYPPPISNKVIFFEKFVFYLKDIEKNRVKNGRIFVQFLAL